MDKKNKLEKALRKYAELSTELKEISPYTERELFAKKKKSAYAAYTEVYNLRCAIMQEEFDRDPKSVSVEELFNLFRGYNYKVVAKKLKSMGILTLADALARWQEIKERSEDYHRTDGSLAPHVWRNLRAHLKSLGVVFTTTVSTKMEVKKSTPPT